MGNPTDGERAPPRIDERGLTLLEVTMVMAVIAVGILGSIAALALVSTQNRVTVDTGRAMHAIRAKVEEMRAASYDEIFTQYTTGGTPGPTFTVDGLATRADGSAQGAVAFLGEADVQAFWGTAIDFNEDGATSSAAPTSAAEAATWNSLPVRVTVRWQDGPGGVERSVATTALIYRMR